MLGVGEWMCGECECVENNDAGSLLHGLWIRLAREHEEYTMDGTVLGVLVPVCFFYSVRASYR